ncbi:hypothetical protein Tco_1165935 [Tanacetum coccineum]
MAFKNFMYAEDDEDLSFLTCKPSLGFGTGSPSISINNEHPSFKIKPLQTVDSEQLVNNTRDSEGSPTRGKAPTMRSGSVAERMKNRKCRTKGSTKPLVKRRLVQAGSSSRATHQKTSPSKVEFAFLTISYDEERLSDVPELQNVTACHLMISNITHPSWKGHLDNQVDTKLLDLHDRCYARKAVVDNAVNRRARELLKIVDQMKVECDVLKEKGNARDREYEELRLKCEAAMTEFDNNSTINVLRQKIKSLSDQVKEHKANMDWILLEIKKWVGYQENLATLESKVSSLEVEKGKLEATEASLYQEVDELAMLVGKLVSYVVFYGRCATFEEVADMKEPFNLEKVKVVADPSASVEALLSKKPQSLCRPTPTKTHAPAPSVPSQKATPSSAPVSKSLSHPPTT